MNNHPIIRQIYLYACALIGLMLVVFGAVQLVNLGLKAWIFTSADRFYAYPVATPAPADKNTPTVTGPSPEALQAYQDAQTAATREKTASVSVALLLIGLPLYLYHWGVIKKDKTNA